MAFLKFISSAFSQQPKADKLLLRMIQDLKPQSIVQLGIGDGQQTLEILGAAGKHHDALHYCGVDMFEASPADRPHVTLREAHKQFSAKAAKVRLVPGEPETALQRCANELTGTDLLVISNQVQQLDTVWTFAPRMLTQNSIVLLETDDEAGWRVLGATELPSVSRNADGKRTAA